MRPHHQHHSLDNPRQHAPHLDIPLSTKARRAICASIGHSRICLPSASPDDFTFSCGRCCTPQRTPAHPYTGWRTLIRVHHDGRLCFFDLVAYQHLRWHDWLFLSPGTVSGLLSALERAATSEVHI